MKYMVYFGMALLLLASALAATTSIPGNMTYQFNFTNASSQVESESFFCAPMIVSQVLNQTNYSVTLDPGESYTFENSQIGIHASCTNANFTSESVCSVTRILNAGEFYDRASGACDLHFKCQAPPQLEEEDEQICLGTAPVEFSKDLKLYSDNDKVYFNWDGEEQRFNKNGTFNYEAQVSYSCPADVKISADNPGAELAAICRESNPYLLDWFDKTLSSYTEQQANCDSFKTENTQQVLSMQQEIAGNGERISACKTELQAKVEALEVVKIEKENVENRQGVYTALNIMLAIWAGIMTALCIILFVTLKNKGGDQ